MSSPKKNVSPIKRQNPNQKTSKISPLNKLQSKRYFCHYSNAVYMGGMECFKKTGSGIMLTDNGACAITTYNHDNMVDHNIIFRDRSVTSIIIGIHRNKNICFRTGPYLLNFYLSNKDKIDGIGYFVHYRNRRIYKLKFDNGNFIIKQRIFNEALVRKVFEQNNLQDMLDPRHIDTIKMNLKLPQEISCVAVNQTYMIGFSTIKKSKNSIVDHNGLCFKITVKQPNYDYDVVLQQRGYIQRGVVHMFGERHFDNGNYYAGEFSLGKFHGQGILIYPRQKKWTFGKYQNGDLQQVIDSSIIGQSTCQDVLTKIHELCKPYFQNKIQFSVGQTYLYSLLKFVDQKDPFQNQSISYTKQQQKKTQHLRMIQDDYTNKKYDVRTQQALKQILASKNKKVQLENVISFKRQNSNLFKQEQNDMKLSQSKKKRTGSLQKRDGSKPTSQQKFKFQRTQTNENPQQFKRTNTNGSLEKDIFRRSYNYEPNQRRPIQNYNVNNNNAYTNQQQDIDSYRYRNLPILPMPTNMPMINNNNQQVPPRGPQPPQNLSNFPNPFINPNFNFSLPTSQFRNDPILIDETPIHALSTDLLKPLQFQASRLRHLQTQIDESRLRRSRDRNVNRSPSPSNRFPQFKYLDDNDDREYMDRIIREKVMRLSNQRYRNQLY